MSATNGSTAFFERSALLTLLKLVIGLQDNADGASEQDKRTGLDNTVLVLTLLKNYVHYYGFIFSNLSCTTKQQTWSAKDLAVACNCIDDSF